LLNALLHSNVLQNVGMK